MQPPKFGPPPTTSEIEAARKASITAFAAADKAHRDYLGLIERARLDVEAKTQFLMRESMGQRPGGYR